jgi:hypothetical protein
MLLENEIERALAKVMDAQDILCTWRDSKSCVYEINSIQARINDLDDVKMTLYHLHDFIHGRVC